MTAGARKAGRKNPLLGAAVVKAVLRKRKGDSSATSVLYEGILRDLGHEVRLADGYRPGRYRARKTSRCG